MDMKKLYAEREKEIAKSYRLQAEGLANDAQRKAAVDKVFIVTIMLFLQPDFSIIKFIFELRIFLNSIFSVP